MSDKLKERLEKIALPLVAGVLIFVVTSLLKGEGLRGLGSPNVLRTAIPVCVILLPSVAMLWHKKWSPRPNVLFYQADYGKIGYDKGNGVFTWNRNFQPEYFAILIKIANELIPDKRGKNLERIKAQITFRYTGGQIYHFSPGTWMETESNAVNFAVGDTRYLVLAVGTSYREWWHTIINRRDDKGSIISLQWNDIPSMIGDAEIDIALVAPSGRAVARMICDMEWKWGEERPYLKNFIFPK